VEQEQPLDKLKSHTLAERVKEFGRVTVPMETARGTVRVPVWAPVLIAALAAGERWQAACAAAGITHRGVNAYLMRHPKAPLVQLLDDARVAATAMLESVAYDRALNGWEEPTSWGGKIQRYDSRLTVEMLKAYKPERYRREALPAVVAETDTLAEKLAIYLSDKPELAAQIKAAMEAAEALPDGGAPAIAVEPVVEGA